MTRKSDVIVTKHSICYNRSLGTISVLFGQVIRGMSAGARVFEYMLIQPTIPVSGGMQLPFNNINGQVEFKDITFSYPTRPGHNVLKHFSLTIEAGKMVALCGPSGSGKSTVAALLERFYEVCSGKILLDGFDIKELDPTWMRGIAIGYIHQVSVAKTKIVLYLYLISSLFQSDLFTTALSLC